MIQFSAELLALTGEPALLVKGGKILFANEAACAMLGPDCRSKSFRELFGKEIAGMQASGYVGETEIAGRRVLLRMRAQRNGTRPRLRPHRRAGDRPDPRRNAPAGESGGHRHRRARVPEPHAPVPEPAQSSGAGI